MIVIIMMIEEKTKYDPAIYGRLRSEFLRNIDPINAYFDAASENNEKLRQQVLKDIQDGKLVTIKPQ